MVDYNPEVLQKYADKLYERAIFAIFYYAILGLVGGVIVGALIQGPIDDIEQDIETGQSHIVDNMCFIFTGIGLIVGIAIGLEKTLELRAKAQLVLCQKEIAHGLGRGPY